MSSNGYSYTDSDGDRLHVRPWSDMVRVDVAHDGRTSSVLLPDDEALTLALAALGSARADSHEVKIAKRMIRRELRARAARREAAEEAERAQAAAQAAQDELDALAWSLYKAHWGMTGSSPDHWVVASPGQAQERERWRKVAQASREALVPQDSAPDLPRFAVVRATKRNGIREFGVLDRNSGDVATFGGLSNAQFALDQVAAAPTRWSWTPAASITHTEEIN